MKAQFEQTIIGAYDDFITHYLTNDDMAHYSHTFILSCMDMYAEALPTDEEVTELHNTCLSVAKRIAQPLVEERFKKLSKFKRGKMLANCARRHNDMFEMLRDLVCANRKKAA